MDSLESTGLSVVTETCDSVTGGIVTVTIETEQPPAEEARLLNTPAAFASLAVTAGA
jgi:hypothetical protein